MSDKKLIPFLFKNHIKIFHKNTKISVDFANHKFVVKYSNFSELSQYFFNIDLEKSGKKSSLWEVSSAGRASALQAGGHRFEPYTSH